MARSEVRPSALHTSYMLGRLRAVLAADNSIVTTAARGAAAKALKDPATLSHEDIAILSETLARLDWPIEGQAHDEPEPPDKCRLTSPSARDLTS